LLRQSITLPALLARAKTLENYAYESPDKNRVMGRIGQYATVQYIYDTLNALNGFYDIQLQPFPALYADGNATVVVNGIDQKGLIMTYSPNGNVIGRVVPVADIGCNRV
jgi:hypothetical protein